MAVTTTPITALDHRGDIRAALNDNFAALDTAVETLQTDVAALDSRTAPAATLTPVEIDQTIIFATTENVALAGTVGGAIAVDQLGLLTLTPAFALTATLLDGESLPTETTYPVAATGAAVSGYLTTATDFSSRDVELTATAVITGPNGAANLLVAWTISRDTAGAWAATGVLTLSES